MSASSLQILPGCILRPLISVSVLAPPKPLKSKDAVPVSPEGSKLVLAVSIWGIWLRTSSILTKPVFLMSVAETTATGLTASNPSDLILVPVVMTSSTSSAASSWAKTEVLNEPNVKASKASR